LQNVKKEKDKKPLKFYSEKLLEALANDVPDYRQNAGKGTDSGKGLETSSKHITTTTYQIAIR
jgi:hypothetical protein